MSSYFYTAVDFGFRPIRPEEDVGARGTSSTARGGGGDGGGGYYCEDGAMMMDCGGSGGGPMDETMEACPPPPTGFGWSPEHTRGGVGDGGGGGLGGGRCSDEDDDEEEEEELFTSDTETLPDATGFGARQRELNALQAQKAAAHAAPSQPGPFHGSTLRELCNQYGELAGTSATPCDVWAEVLETLREKEEKKGSWCLDPSTARHMKYRTTLIEWILEVCADFNFGPTTADLAVQYMDRVLSKVNVPKTSLQLVAMCCLEIAVKFEEVEQNVPSLPKLRKCASNVYSVEIIKKMELAVLIELEWELAMVVPAHFLEAVLAVTGGGTFPHDDVGDQPWTSACTAQLRKLSCYLHSICLQDANIAMRMPPSQLAAAIIATARLQLNIYPVWPAELHVATGYSCDRLGPAMSKVLQLFKELLPVAGAGGGGGGGGRGFGHGAQQGGAAAAAGTGVVGMVPSGAGAAGGVPYPVHTDMGMMDAVMHALDQQPNAPAGGKHGYPEGSRETLTPSPTGPLDAGGFFNVMQQ